MPLNRKGKPCRAKVRTEIGSSGDFITPGTEGKILATRTKERLAVVLWTNRSHGVHPLADLEWW